MRKTFIAIVLDRPDLLSMYRQVETDLSAVKDIEHFKQMLKEEAVSGHSRCYSGGGCPMRTLEHHAQILACKDELVDQPQGHGLVAN
jgi:hypothetical protein